MTKGGLTFIDCESEQEDDKLIPSNPPKNLDHCQKSKHKRIKDLKDQIESGDYKVPMDDLAEALVKRLSEES